jgi:hypothetical protein
MLLREYHKLPKYLLVIVMCLGSFISCTDKQTEKAMSSEKETLDARIQRLGKKYDLHAHYFDAECLYEPGDLAATTDEFLAELLPTDRFEVKETLSDNGKQYIATVYHAGKVVGIITADVGGDYLPDQFYSVVEAIPERMNHSRRIYMINPLLFGQDGCFVSGTEKNLLQARHDGLPVVLPEDGMEEWKKADLSEFEE